ncbi:hypothetical protein H9P43_003031 [Blastocladiella emersonii ATCC 22665]|nr:hypothetical protein H9P43_003031 [Blastocladiella emersonii ATCC 22665]
MFGLTRVFPALRRQKLLRRFLYLLVLLAAWVGIIVPTYMVYRHEITDSNVLPSSALPTFPHYLNVSARLANIDPLRGTCRLTLDLMPVLDGPGTVTPETELFSRINGERRLKVPVTLFLQDVRKSFAVDDRLGSIDVTLPFEDGDTRDYPFDQYTSIVDIVAQVTVNATRAVPLRFTLNGAVPGFSLEKIGVFVDEGQGFGTVLLSLTIGRSGTTKGFSIFINFLNWCLALIMGYLALQVARKKRTVEPPLLAPPCALLFALPSLRNVQPGVPGIGVTVDVLAFFWNMAIVAISAIVIILYYILRWSKPSAASSDTATAAAKYPEPHRSSAGSGSGAAAGELPMYASPAPGDAFPMNSLGHRPEHASAVAGGKVQF